MNGNESTPRKPSRRRYAEGTNVSSMQSRLEIERSILRFGAKNFATFQSDEHAAIMFEIKGRRVKFELALPSRKDAGIATYMNGSVTFRRTESAIEDRYEQAIRERWRALALLIKAKLAAVDAGITTVEDELLAQTIVPTAEGAATVSQVMQEQITQAYERGMVPAGLNLLALGPGQ